MAPPAMSLSAQVVAVTMPARVDVVVEVESPSASRNHHAAVRASAPRSFRAQGKANTSKPALSNAQVDSPVYNTERFSAILGESFPAGSEQHNLQAVLQRASSASAAGAKPGARSADAAPPTLCAAASSPSLERSAAASASEDVSGTSPSPRKLGSRKLSEKSKPFWQLQEERRMAKGGATPPSPRRTPSAETPAEPSGPQHENGDDGSAEVLTFADWWTNLKAPVKGTSGWDSVRDAISKPSKYAVNVPETLQKRNCSSLQWPRC